MLNQKELSLCHKLNFSISCIFRYLRQLGKLVKKVLEVLDSHTYKYFFVALGVYIFKIQRPCFQLNFERNDWQNTFYKSCFGLKNCCTFFIFISMTAIKIIFKTKPTLKCRSALPFDFTVHTFLHFFCSP